MFGWVLIPQDPTEHVTEISVKSSSMSVTTVTDMEDDLSFLGTIKGHSLEYLLQKKKNFFDIINFF